jgi:hypothetical protein
MMATKHSCLLILLSLPVIGFGQSWTFVTSIEVPQTITTIDTGLSDKVYVGTNGGNVYSFLADGTPLTEFSSAIFQPVTSIDASNTLRVFVYYKDVNTFEYLDRFSAFPRTYVLADFDILSGDFATTGLNNTIWVLSGKELVQLNAFNRSILLRKSLNVPMEGVVGLHIGESILVADRHGIKDFSLNGTLINEVSASGIQNLHMDGATVMAVCSEGLLIWNRITTLSSIINLPGNFSMAVRTGKNYHFVKGSTLHTYRLEE